MKKRRHTSKLEEDFSKAYKAFCKRKGMKTGKWTGRKIKP